MNQQKTVAEPLTGSGIDRRKLPRYRWGAPILVRKPEGPDSKALALEISEGGLSIAFYQGLNIGDTVELGPIVDRNLTAVVRHNRGTIYGLEFVGLTDEDRNHIKQLCQKLPLFDPRSLRI
jgi:hypothetical protein